MMSDPSIAQEAIDAAEAALRAFLEPWLTAEVYGSTLDSQLAQAARLALRDAERVWPHEPPKRDPASATGGSFVIRNAPQQATAFGFGLPGAYAGGASVDEGYRDEKWQDAQT